jgi:hypothetical protein
MEMQPETEKFIQHAQVYESAYNAHVKKYSLRNPPPQKPQAQMLISWHHVVVTIILIASALVSASHTLLVVFKAYPDQINPVLAGFLAFITFIMVEVTAVYLAYTDIIENTTIDETPSIKKPVRIGLFIVVGAMFAMNIYGVLNTSGTVSGGLWEIVGILIFLWVACIAPANAYIAGEILAIRVIDMQRQNAILEEDYIEALEKWNTSLDSSWNSKKKDYGVSIKVSKPTDNQPGIAVNAPRLSASTSNQTDNRQMSGAGYAKSSTAVDNAVQWLKDNPDKIDLSLRQLADLIPDAGKDSIGKARKIVKRDG